MDDPLIEDLMISVTAISNRDIEHLPTLVLFLELVEFTKQSRLSKEEVEQHMAELVPDLEEAITIESLMHSGSRLGLIRAALTDGHYVFPVLQVLKFVSQSQRESVFRKLISLQPDQLQFLVFDKSIQDTIQEALRTLNPSMHLVIELREQLHGGPKHTLEEIGALLGLTRERIRQIESNFWNRFAKKLNKVLLLSLVCEILRHRGRLVFWESWQSIRFAARCCNIPFTEEFGCFVLGTRTSDFELLHSEYKKKSLTGSRELGGLLEKQETVILPRDEMLEILSKYEKLRDRRLSKSQKVRLALERIGRPAHYSEVAELYNEMFPFDISNDNSIHAALSREEHGVVWIGVRGTFALREWGYEHPDHTLFQTVAKIVRNIYSQTHNPVSLQVIKLEMAKYRKVLNPSSIQMAAYLNSDLECIKNSFLPKGKAKRISARNKVKEERIHKTIAAFQHRLKKK